MKNELILIDFDDIQYAIMRDLYVKFLRENNMLIRAGRTLSTNKKL